MLTHKKYRFIWIQLLVMACFLASAAPVMGQACPTAPAKVWSPAALLAAAVGATIFPNGNSRMSGRLLRSIHQLFSRYQYPAPGHYRRRGRPCLGYTDFSRNLRFRHRGNRALCAVSTWPAKLSHLFHNCFRRERHWQCLDYLNQRAKHCYHIPRRHIHIHFVLGFEYNDDLHTGNFSGGGHHCGYEPHAYQRYRHQPEGFGVRADNHPPLSHTISPVSGQLAHDLQPAVYQRSQYC